VPGALGVQIVPARSACSAPRVEAAETGFNAEIAESAEVLPGKFSACSAFESSLRAPPAAAPACAGPGNSSPTTAAFFLLTNCRIAQTVTLY
jgi:hypothetical protein